MLKDCFPINFKYSTNVLNLKLHHNEEATN